MAIRTSFILAAVVVAALLATVLNAMPAPAPATNTKYYMNDAWLMQQLAGNIPPCTTQLLIKDFSDGKKFKYNLLCLDDQKKVDPVNSAYYTQFESQVLFQCTSEVAGLAQHATYLKGLLLQYCQQ